MDDSPSLELGGRAARELRWLGETPVVRQGQVREEQRQLVWDSVALFVEQALATQELREWLSVSVMHDCLIGMDDLCEFTCRIVTCAEELVSIYIYYSTRECFNTFLSGFITSTYGQVYVGGRESCTVPSYWYILCRVLIMNITYLSNYCLPLHLQPLHQPQHETHARISPVKLRICDHAITLSVMRNPELHGCVMV